MTLKASRLPVLAGLLCLLLMGFAGASYGAVRFDVVPSPTEVINTGRSEVLGSINLVAFGTDNVTGSSLGGAAQIGILYNNPAVMIDNDTSCGIRLFFSKGFTSAFIKTAASGNVGIVKVENIDLNGKAVGFITINLAPGAKPAEGDFIRIEGVRGRIDASGTGLTPGTNFFAQLQSINDPSANQFQPETVRVATSFDGMNVQVSAMNLLLCFPDRGLTPGGVATNFIKITEGFARAFVDSDSDGAGVDATDRVDSGGQTNPQVYNPFTTGGTVGAVPPAGVAGALGAPTNPTQFLVVLDSIPDSVGSIVWPATAVDQNGTGSSIVFVTATGIVGGQAIATYQYKAVNQTGASDLIIETFSISPALVLATGKTSTGVVLAGVTLAPAVTAQTTLAQPSCVPARPRFLWVWESDNIAQGNPPDDPFRPYASIIRCNCFLLFTYVTADSAWDTGIAVANTTGDTEVFGAANAPDQLGKITFYFYDKAKGYVGSFTTPADVLPGASYVNVLSAMIANVTPTKLTSFSGYVIAKAEFQFCHALAFIADTKFGAIAHGYIANVIPDPAIKNVNGRRAAVAASDATNILAGESLNN